MISIHDGDIFTGFIRSNAAGPYEVLIACTDHILQTRSNFVYNNEPFVVSLPDNEECFSLLVSLTVRHARSQIVLFSHVISLGRYRWDVVHDVGMIQHHLPAFIDVPWIADIYRFPFIQRMHDAMHAFCISYVGLLVRANEMDDNCPTLYITLAQLVACIIAVALACIITFKCLLSISRKTVNTLRIDRQSAYEHDQTAVDNSNSGNNSGNNSNNSSGRSNTITGCTDKSDSVTHHTSSRRNAETCPQQTTDHAAATTSTSTATTGQKGTAANSGIAVATAAAESESEENFHFKTHSYGNGRGKGKVMYLTLNAHYPDTTTVSDELFESLSIT